MSRIEPRPGLEVFVNESGTISIAQIDGSFPNDAPIIDVHPDSVPDLIRLLMVARAEVEEAAEEKAASAVAPVQEN